jgi:hypothetical protein
MAYENFNGNDGLIHGLLSLLDKPVENFLKGLGISTEQINTIGAGIVYTAAKKILDTYLRGYNLYQNEIAMLKQYALVIRDDEVTKKVSAFLAAPSDMSAKDAYDELSRSELKLFAQKAANTLNGEEKK